MRVALTLLYCYDTHFKVPNFKIIVRLHPKPFGFVDIQLTSPILFFSFSKFKLNISIILECDYFISFSMFITLNNWQQSILTSDFKWNEFLGFRFGF